METTVPPEITRQVIEHQLQIWRNTMEDFRIAIIVADAVEDKPESDRLKGEMKKVIRRIEKLMAMLDELPKADSE